MIAVLNPRHPVMKGCVNCILTPYAYDYQYDHWEKDPDGHFISVGVDLEWSMADLAFIADIEPNPSMYRCYLPDEVKVWIVNNIEYEWIYEIRPHQPYKKPLVTNRFVFYFKASNDALLFQLRW